MRRNHWGLIVFLFASFVAVSGQVPVKLYNEQLGTLKLVVFAQEAQPEFENWKSFMAKLAGSSSNSDWRIYAELKDELGQIHYRAKQYYNQIPLENGMLVIHTLNAKILSINGEMIPESKISGKFILSEQEALQKALAYLPAEKYYWQDSGLNQVLQKITGVLDTSYFPKGKTTYVSHGFDLSQSQKLAWKFNILAIAPLAGKSIFVDAETGEITAAQELILHTEVTGSAVTKYSGTKTIKTDSTAPGNYRLKESARGNGIETLNMKKGISYGASVDFTDADNNWNNVNANKDEVATDAHWGAEMTYDYYKSVHSRNSYDNKGAKIFSYIHYGNNYNNAFWNGSYMTYGDGDGSVFTPLTGLDVCGHEITHAVTTNSAALVYSYESGALNESFSDVFGNSIEQWARPTKWNWRIGEDITPSGNGIRSMTNPNLFSHPKFYKGVSWYAGAGDNGGVHYNSGVQNYWYYLIANGGKGTNEKGWAFKIDSLGIDKAGKIAYRNLTVYLTSSSQYADARTFSIMAATDLYGLCSKEVIAVTNAWWVCGVGAKYDSAYVKADFRADTLGCFTSSNIKFTNLSDNSVGCKWYFGDSTNSTVVNPTHSYSSYGQFNIKLVATSCFFNKKDSITKVKYVRIDSTPDICNAILMPKTGTDSSNTKCKGFIYDDGGEGNYGALKTVYLKVTVPGADSIRYRFLLLDYEKGFDSLYLYKTAINNPNKIGGYTGNVLPNAGVWQSVFTNTLWLKQFSDPLQEGKGFKIQFEGIRKAIAFNLGKDTTICLGDSLVFNPAITGGYTPNFGYGWNTGSTLKKLIVKPTTAATYILQVKDVCTGKFKLDTIIVNVRAALNVDLGKDTVICDGRSVKLNTISTGGLNTSYNYKWNNGLPALASHTVTPAATTTYMIVLNDGCTPLADTAYKKVTVKPALKANVASTSALVCIGKGITLTANGSGGDTTKYVYTWNNGLGNGTSKSPTLKDTTLYKVTLTDGCSVKSSYDSVWVYTYPALQVKVPKDTFICRGSTIGIDANANGGKGVGYTFKWSSGEIAFGISKVPTVPTWYKVTLNDGCSPSAQDSIYVDLLAPLSLTKVNDSTLCDGQTITLNLVGAGGKNATRVLSWNPGTVSGYTPALSPAPGVTNYTVVLSDACTVKNDTTKFKITKLAPLAATIAVTPPIICAGDSITLKLTLTGGKKANYAVLVDGASTAWLTSRIQPLISKTYNLNLTDGCSIPASSSAGLTISPAAQATLKANPLLVCANNPIDFTYKSPDAAMVMWYFSTKDSSNGTGIAFPKLFPGAGAFTAKAKVTTSAGCVAVFNLVDTIKAVAYPKASFTPAPAVTNIESPDIQFNDASVGATSYLWDFGDGLQSSFVGVTNHTYTDTGWFNVRLRVSITPGCADSTSKLVRIKDIFHVFVPSSFSPDQNGINDVYLPKGRAFKTFQMTIFNRWGMKVFESNDMTKGWDGTDGHGKLWAPASYAVLVVILDTEEIRHVEKGTVVLLR